MLLIALHAALEKCEYIQQLRIGRPVLVESQTMIQFRFCRRFVIWLYARWVYGIEAHTIHIFIYGFLKCETEDFSLEIPSKSFNHLCINN